MSCGAAVRREAAGGELVASAAAPAIDVGLNGLLPTGARPIPQRGEAAARAELVGGHLGAAPQARQSEGTDGGHPRRRGRPRRVELDRRWGEPRTTDTILGSVAGPVESMREKRVQLPRGGGGGGWDLENRWRADAPLLLLPPAVTTGSRGICARAASGRGRAPQRLAPPHPRRGCR